VVSLEFLRPDHGHEQIGEQQQGNDPHNQVFHRFLTFFRRAGYTVR
jgi:hypothetical protein